MIAWGFQSSLFIFLHIVEIHNYEINTKLDIIAHMMPLPKQFIPTPSRKWFFYQQKLAFSASRIIWIIYRCGNKMLHSTNSIFLLTLVEHWPKFSDSGRQMLPHPKLKPLKQFIKYFNQIVDQVRYGKEIICRILLIIPPSLNMQ